MTALPPDEAPGDEPQLARNSKSEQSEMSEKNKLPCLFPALSLHKSNTRLFPEVLMKNHAEYRDNGKEYNKDDGNVEDKLFNATARLKDGTRATAAERAAQSRSTGLQQNKDDGGDGQNNLYNANGWNPLSQNLFLTLLSCMTYQLLNDYNTPVDTRRDVPSRRFPSVPTATPVSPQGCLSFGGSTIMRLLMTRGAKHDEMARMVAFKQITRNVQRVQLQSRVFLPTLLTMEARLLA